MTKKSQFEVGTIVKLKSGGPDMTVEEICVSYSTKQPTGNVDCQWFAGKKLEKGRFPTDSLVLVPQALVE